MGVASGCGDLAGELQPALSLFNIWDNARSCIDLLGVECLAGSKAFSQSIHCSFRTLPLPHPWGHASCAGLYLNLHFVD